MIILTMNHEIHDKLQSIRRRVKTAGAFQSSYHLICVPRAEVKSVSGTLPLLATIALLHIGQADMRVTRHAFSHNRQKAVEQRLRQHSQRYSPESAVAHNAHP